MSTTTTIVHYDAILFDMDGTLVDSAAGVEGAWKLFAEKYKGLDVTDILSSSHGVRTVENLRKHCGIEDPEELEREAERFERAIVETAGQNGRGGIVLLPGAQDIMTELHPGRTHPNPVWAICTSATRVYATAALAAVKITIPDVFVTADDVTKGKPEPDPYLLGAKGCGIDPSRCLVVEDAPSGIRSGNSAGCQTLALLTSHSLEQVRSAKPTFIVENLASVKMTRSPSGGVDVTITTAISPK